eukprot:343298-Prorocentrum_lima.AAC.1
MLGACADLDERVNDVAAQIVATRGSCTANDLVLAIKQARIRGNEELAWGLELHVRILMGRRAAAGLLGDGHELRDNG